jgi:hypothetical protein
MPGSQRGGSSKNYKAKKFNENFKCFAKLDYNSVFIFESKRYKNDCRNFDSRNNIYTSDISIFKK